MNAQLRKSFRPEPKQTTKITWHYTDFNVSTELVTEHRTWWKYSASHSRVAPENVGLQKEQKFNSFAWHTRNEVRLCVLWIRKKEVGNTKR
jgi:hypothetical protein